MNWNNKVPADVGKELFLMMSLKVYNVPEYEMEQIVQFVGETGHPINFRTGHAGAVQGTGNAP